MPNYQPNYIYSPRYGSRYMGNNTPAPATGGIGQADPLSAPVNYEAGVNSASKQGSVGTGVPATLGAPPVMSMDGNAVGWTSGTGRDTSAISNLGDFGFRGLAAKDPFNEDYFKSPTTPGTVTSPVTASPVPQQQTIPYSGSSSSSPTSSSSWVDTQYTSTYDPLGMLGDGQSYVSTTYDAPGGQGLINDGFIDDTLMTLGYNDNPLLTLLSPLGTLAGNLYVDNKIDSIGESIDALDAKPGAITDPNNYFADQLVTISDSAGNVRTVTQSQADAIYDINTNYGRDDGKFTSSAFGNVDEAKAVAEFGLGSDQQFDAIQKQYDMLGASGSTRAEGIGTARSGFDKSIADVDMSNMTADQMEQAINGSQINDMSRMTAEARADMTRMQNEWAAQDEFEYEIVKDDFNSLGIDMNGMDRKAAQAALPQAQAAYDQAQKLGVSVEGLNVEQAQHHVAESQKAYDTAAAKASKYGVNISGQGLAQAQMTVAQAETNYNMAVTQAQKAGVSTSGTTAQINARIKAASDAALAKNSSQGTSSLSSTERAAIVASTGKSPPNVSSGSSSYGGYYGDSSGGTNSISGKSYTPNYDFNPNDFTSNYGGSSSSSSSGGK